MGKRDELLAMTELLSAQRWASLATLDEEGLPLASMVAYASEPNWTGLLLHLSRLAEHTGNLLARPSAALAVTAPDSGQGDPQQLARVTLQGQVTVIGREDPAFGPSRSCYLARLPDAEPLFDFPDFMLFRFAPKQLRFVGGFARAFSYHPEELAKASALPTH